jgi:hypothetical protein
VAIVGGRGAAVVDHLRIAVTAVWRRVTHGCPEYDRRRSDDRSATAARSPSTVGGSERHDGAMTGTAVTDRPSDGVRVSRWCATATSARDVRHDAGGARRHRHTVHRRTMPAAVRSVTGGQTSPAYVRFTGAHDAGVPRRHRHTVHRPARCRRQSTSPGFCHRCAMPAVQCRRRTAHRGERCRWLDVTVVPSDGARDAAVSGATPCCLTARGVRRDRASSARFRGASDVGGVPSGGRRGAFDGGAVPCPEGVDGHPVTCPHTEIWRLGLRHLNYGLRHA